MAGRYSSVGKVFNNMRKSENIASAFKVIGTPALRRSSRGLGAEALMRRGKRRVVGAAGVLGMNAMIGPNGNRDRRRGF